MRIKWPWGFDEQMEHGAKSLSGNFKASSQGYICLFLQSFTSLAVSKQGWHWLTGTGTIPDPTDPKSNLRSFPSSHHYTLVQNLGFHGQIIQDWIFYYFFLWTTTSQLERICATSSKFATNPPSPNCKSELIPNFQVNLGITTSLARSIFAVSNTNLEFKTRAEGRVGHLMP